MARRAAKTKAAESVVTEDGRPSGPGDELVLQARGGDRSAFETLYANLLPNAWLWASRATGDQSAAEEVVSDSMMQLVRQLPELPNTESGLAGWLKVVVRNKSVDWIRRQQRHRAAVEQMAEQLNREMTPSPTAGAVEQLLKEELFGQLRDALEVMSEPQQTALRLRYQAELSLDEIAQELKMTVPATNSLLYRARIQLRAAVREQAEPVGSLSNGADLDWGGDG